MDVLVGPTFSIVAAQDGHSHGRMFVRRNETVEEEASSDSSSSIGAPDDSEDDSKEENGDGDEVQSKFNGGGVLGSLGSFGSLEESLPIKRGLSNYFSGKSKSFASLSEVSSVSSVKEVEKRDNPLNKRRRVLIASKWSRKSASSSSLYNWPNPKSMPMITLNEDESEDHHQQEDEDDEDEDESDQSSSEENEKLMRRAPNKKFLDKGLKSFKSQSCYCLSDLQEH